MKPLGIIELKFIFQHPYQFIRVEVGFVVIYNCTSENFILGNDYFSIHGIDSSTQKDRYFAIGDNKRQQFVFLINTNQITLIKHEETTPEKHLFISEQLKEEEFNQSLTEKMKEKPFNLLHKYKSVFETKKEPLATIIGHEVDIILNVNEPYSPLLKNHLTQRAQGLEEPWRYTLNNEWT
ncbi:hypothetical protein O181_001914 [Austropuccinia psidii MF-1]|uniref:Uncharacterized protein n=1 Tax=Austropuccinia psidii MF-1 TaxID=1389203 RepID=A0A9Q3BBG2_9BASI|nr:hypothetical protein [Austropuccinia psidii MF-1]